MKELVAIRSEHDVQVDNYLDMWNADVITVKNLYTVKYA